MDQTGILKYTKECFYTAGLILVVGALFIWVGILKCVRRFLTFVIDTGEHLEVPSIMILFSIVMLICLICGILGTSQAFK